MEKLLKEDIYEIVRKIEDKDLGEIAKAINPEVQLKNGFAVPENDDYTNMKFMSSFGKIFIEDNIMQAISNQNTQDDEDDEDDEELDLYQNPICKVNGTEIPLVMSGSGLRLFQDKDFTVLYEVDFKKRIIIVLVTVCKTESLNQPTLEEKRAYRRGYLKGLREASKRFSK